MWLGPRRRKEGYSGQGRIFYPWLQGSPRTTCDTGRGWFGPAYRPVWLGTGGASRIKRMVSRRLALALGSSGSSGSDPALPATS